METFGLDNQSTPKKVLRKFNMENAKAVDTPVDASTKLVKTNEDSESTDREQFQSAVGSLLYLSTMTRPDITYAVSNRPFLHSSQARARKHESEAQVDKHQTWRTTPRNLRRKLSVLASDWCQKICVFLAPIRSQNGGDRLELVW